MKFLKLLCYTAILSGLMSLTGCAAIQHREMDVQAKMSHTIFLDADKLSEDKPIYVRVTNTSDFQEIDFSALLKQKLAAKGRTLTKDPKQASHSIQANLLYLGQEKNDNTYEGALAGGVGGALGGAYMARNAGGGGNVLAAGAVGLVGAGIGALAGAMVHVDTYMGICDIQVKEVVDGGVTGKMTSNLAQGSGTTVQTERKIKSDKQEYSTRIAVKAVQTNIDRKKATDTIAERLASQIAGLF